MEWIGGGDGKDGDGTGVRKGSGARCVKGGMDEWMVGKGVGKGCVRMARMRRRERWTKDGGDMGVMCEKRGRWMNGWVEVDEWMGE